MQIPLFQVDAFANQLFRGNPAAVCPLEEPISDELQQSIAFENQLSETAFLHREGEGYRLRWFTPEAEVDLCGHATLAAGHVVLTELDVDRERVHFETMSGVLLVERAGDGYRLELPARPGEPVATEGAEFDRLLAALGARPQEVRSTGRDFYALFSNETEVRELRPDFRAVAAVGKEAIGVGAPGDDVDLVSRYFAPRFGIDEDPVTGSAHATWIPWFAERTGKARLTCRQISRRVGELTGELAGDRVRLEGSCVTYLRGTIEAE
jgi:PhzF family phenazine biosynthesis protein